MNTLLFVGQDFDAIRDNLLSKHVESCAILYISPVVLNGFTKFLVSEVEIVPDNAYLSRSSIGAELSPTYVAFIAKKAKLAGRSLCFVHTHPGIGQDVSFSSVDDLGEARLARFLSERMPESQHLALVLSHSGCECRILGTRTTVRVLSIGQHLVELNKNSAQSDCQTKYDRQVRAFGKQGQELINNVRIAIVGLGGTGSVVAQELAHLGVSKFLLIDRDRVEQTNLNRLVGAGFDDIGARKIDIAGRNVRFINNSADCEMIFGDVVSSEVARKVLECDLVFCCTDSHGSRAVLGQIAYQYLIPCIDMGVVIVVNDGCITHLTGRVQMLAPGLGCLACSNFLDANAVRRDLMNQEQQAADPYFIGGGAPQPAVISLNSTVASLAVTMLLSSVAGVPSKPRFLMYDGINGIMRPIIQSIQTNCIVCSRQGSLARGDEWPLPVRRS